MRITDIISNAFISNTTGGVILGGSAGSLLSFSTIGALLGLAVGIYAFYSSRPCAEEENNSANAK